MHKTCCWAVLWVVCMGKYYKRFTPKHHLPLQPPEIKENEFWGEFPFVLLPWAPPCSHPRPASYGRQEGGPAASCSFLGLWQQLALVAPAQREEVLQKCGLSGVWVLRVKTQWHARTVYTSESWIWDGKSLRLFTQQTAWLWQNADNKFHSWWLLGSSSASLHPAPWGWVFAFSLHVLQSLWLALIAKWMLIT